MKRAALIGCGDVSAVHLEALKNLADVEIVGIADSNPELSQAVGKELGVPHFEFLSDLLSQKPDVLHITTPHDAHVDYAIEALSRGIHVIVEKPLGHTENSALRLTDFVAGLGSKAPKIAVCYQNRYNVSSVELKRLIDSGSLGQIYGGYATVAWTRTKEYYTAKPWRGKLDRAGGGLLMNQAIHTLDLLQWFFGDVVATTGQISTDKYAAVSEVEDTATALFTHQSGVTTSFYGTLTLSKNRPVEIELDCENAQVRLSAGLEVSWNDGRVERFEERTANSNGRSYWGVSHELLIADFYSQLDSEAPFWISPAEAMKSLGMAKQVYRSSNQKSNIE